MTTVNNHQTKTSLQLTSPAFEEGGNIPDSYTCQGQNVNPPLNITNVPGAAASLALIMHDPDAVSGDFVHWLMWDIPPSTKTIATGNVPSGVIQGLNSASQSKYMGPCPPSGTGTHRYMFELYALDESPKNLDMETSREQLQKAMANHILAQHTLTGLFSAPTSR
ncbi:YbhB/YbcL family Raf kinase inhibitor-like protein [Candidatus Saccharibacteria bacterium]|nr:YbhB/YbcL family Raf kinase inhibitor-like protein [Candidatus Saccharibacteria bacterium]